MANEVIVQFYGHENVILRPYHFRYCIKRRFYLHRLSLSTEHIFSKIPFKPVAECLY